MIPKPERDAALIAHYLNNGSLRVTGAEFGLTQQGVSYILARHRVGRHERSYRRGYDHPLDEIEATARTIYNALGPHRIGWFRATRPTHDRYRVAARAVIEQQNSSNS